MRNSGIRVDHVKDDRAYYNFFENRVVLPERSQFPSQSAYTHTVLHELGAEAIRRVERELMTVLQEAGAAGYGRGYDDAAAGLARRAPCNPERATDRGPGDAAQSLLDDATAKGYLRGYDDRIRGASRADAAVRRHQVSLRQGGDRGRRPGAGRASLRPAARAGSRSEAAAAPSPGRAGRINSPRTTRRYAASGGRHRCSTRRRRGLSAGRRAEPLTDGDSDGKGGTDGETACIWLRLVGLPPANSQAACPGDLSWRDYSE